MTRVDAPKGGQDSAAVDSAAVDDVVRDRVISELGREPIQLRLTQEPGERKVLPPRPWRHDRAAGPPAAARPGRDAGPVRDHVGRVSERAEQPGQDRLAQGVTLSQSWLNAMLS